MITGGSPFPFSNTQPDISPFTSKFDAYLKGNYTLTADEVAGYQLFNGKGNCNSCHVDGRSTTLTSGQTDTGNTASVKPLFTCFGFANEGLPLNPRICLFYESTPDRFGFTPNPDGFALPRFGTRQFPQERPAILPRSEPAAVAIACADGGRPNAGDDGPRCGADAAAMPDHRGGRSTRTGIRYRISRRSSSTTATSRA